MQILAIDTATDLCSVAIWNNGIIYNDFKECLYKHNNYILSMIKSVIDKSSVTLTNVDAIAFNHGPGSFTGIRIGVGVAQGLALGAEIPIIGISALVIMAQRAWRNLGAKKVLVAIDANMEEIYWAKYIRDKYGIWHGKESETIIKTKEINKRLSNLSGCWITVGTGWKNWYKMTKSELRNNNLNYNKIKDGGILNSMAEDMLPIAYHLFCENKFIEAEKAKPFYLKKIK